MCPPSCVHLKSSGCGSREGVSFVEAGGPFRCRLARLNAWLGGLADAARCPVVRICVSSLTSEKVVSFVAVLVVICIVMLLVAKSSSMTAKFWTTLSKRWSQSSNVHRLLSSVLGRVGSNLVRTRPMFGRLRPLCPTRTGGGIQQRPRCMMDEP